MTRARSDEAARPRLALPLDPLDHLIEALALAGWLTLLALTVALWPTLPQRLPLHFDAAGRPDGWGARSSFLTLPILGTVLYAALTVVRRFPHAYNYPWPITAANAERQYRLARRMIAAIKAIAVWLFAGLLWGTAQVASGGAQGLNSAILPLTLLAFPITLTLYFVAARRAR